MIFPVHSSAYALSLRRGPHLLICSESWSESHGHSLLFFLPWMVHFPWRDSLLFSSLAIWLLLSCLFPSFCLLCVSFALLVLGSLCGSLCYWFETFCFSNVSIWCCQFPAQHCFAVSHTVWYVVFSVSFIFHSFSVFFYFSWDFLFDLWIFFEVCCLVSKC